MSSLAADSGIFDTIAGLPVHPLVVHVAVIMLPLSAVAFIALVVVRRWRGTFGWLTVAGLVVGAGAALAAKESGEALAQRVGTPAQHASYGTILPVLGFLLAVVALGWFVLQRRAASAVAARAADASKGQRGGASSVAGAGAVSGGDSGAVTTLGWLGALLAVGVLIMTVLVGHSGAEAVWGGRIAATNAGASSSVSTPTVAPSPTASASASASRSAASPAAGTYAMADVATHNSAQSCWSVVNGGVYDLTAWISQHPGGPGVIKAMCGVDSTSAFLGQHSGQRRPTSELASFKIGTLAG